MQKYLGKNIRTKFGQLLASFGGASIFLRNALLVMILVGSIGAGFSSVSAKAEVTGGFKVTGREAYTPLVENCSRTSPDDQSGFDTINLGSRSISDKEKELIKKCVGAKLGNGNGTQGNAEIIATLTGCEFSLKDVGKDLFCAAASRKDSTDFFAPTHWKFTQDSCPKTVFPETDPRNLIGNTRFPCTDAQISKGKECFGRKDNGFVICDSPENGERPTQNTTTDGATNSRTFTDNGWTCQVEVRSTTTNTSSFGGWKCSKGSQIDIASTDPKNECNLFNGFGSVQSSLVCTLSKINFADGESSKFWINKNFSSFDGINVGDFKIEKADKSFYRLDGNEILKYCKIEVRGAEVETFKKGTAGADCKKTKQDEVLAAIKADCAAQPTGATCESRPGESGDQNGGVANSASNNSQLEKNAKGGDNPLGGIFTILYKVVLVILLIVLILIEYLQLIVLTIMSYIISALLDLSPTAPILTKIGLPLWGIFANLANFLVVGFMVYVGAATMVGLRKTDQAGKDIVTISVLALLLNTTYFFLNFVISVVDGFAKLLVAVFVGKGGLFGLFTGMFGLFSKVSVLRPAGQAIDVSNPISYAQNIGGSIGAIGTAVGKSFELDSAGLTFVFLGEALVVISFFIILWIFKDTFVLVFARVTILLLLLITSPVWVVAYFLKDIFKSSQISAAISKLPSQLFGTIVFNFAMVLGVIITVLITGSAQDGFRGYQLDVGGNGGATAGGTTADFLSPSGASLVIAGVVPVFLGVSVLYFINQSFKGLFPLLDKIGQQVGNGITEAAKGVISGDVKGGFVKSLKGASYLATGGGQIQNAATLAPKLAVKGGVIGAGIGASVGDIATGNRFKLRQKVANFEEQRLMPFLKEGGVGETVGGALGNKFGKDSVIQQIATKRAEYIAAEKKKKRENAIGQGTTEEERRWNAGRGRGIVADNAKTTEALENAKGQTSAEKGGIEEESKEKYNSTTAGQDALKARVIAEEQRDLLKKLADNKQQETKDVGKSNFYSDPTNDKILEDVAKSSIKTDLNKQISESLVATAVANSEQQAYTQNASEYKGLYNVLSNQKYGTNGQSVAENNRTLAKDNVLGSFKAKLNAENAAKREEEKQKQEKENKAAYSAAKSGTGTAYEKQLYDDAVSSWTETRNKIQREIYTFGNDPANFTGGVATGGTAGMKPGAKPLFNSLMDELDTHDSKEP